MHENIRMGISRVNNILLTLDINSWLHATVCSQG